MVCRARAMAPTASQVVICEASSKMTTSKSAWLGGRYWLAEILGHGPDHLANGAAGALQLHLVTQQAEFGVPRHALDRWKTMGYGRQHPLAGLGPHHVVDLAELGDGVFVLEATEAAQHRIEIKHQRCPPARIAEPERCAGLFGRDAASLQLIDQRTKPLVHGLLAAATPTGPVA